MELRSCGAAQKGRKNSVEYGIRNFKWMLGEKMELAVPGNGERDAMREGFARIPQIIRGPKKLGQTS